MPRPKSPKRPTYAWEPQPGPQLDAIVLREIPELFYGGSRGAGKSFYLLGDFLQDVDEFQDIWQGVIFRRTYNELEQLMADSHSIYGKLKECEWKEGKKQWEWKNGAILKMRFIDSLQDCDKYQGHAYPWIAFDELTNWPSLDPYFKMRACNRWAANRLIDEHIIPFKRIRSTGNPGGPGHVAVKSYFVDPAPLGGTPIPDSRTGKLRIYIAAKVTDNKILMQNDPEYIDDLRMVGNEQLVRAWLDGDWSVILGAYFTEFSYTHHVVEPFTIPDEWTKFASHDWGSSAPFVHQWFAISDGSLEGYPKGAMIMYRECYGGSAPNVGLKLPAEDAAEMILSKQRQDERITYTVIDPQCFKSDGGPTIAERFRRSGLNVRAGDSRRLAGWNMVRSRLRGNPKGDDPRPMIYFFKTCLNAIRTIPAMQHSERDPEDIDDRGDDHCADCLKLACMSRPYSVKKKIKPQGKTLHTMTYDEFFQAEEQRMNQVEIV